MKKLNSGADLSHFNKNDIIELIKKLPIEEQRILKKNIDNRFSPSQKEKIFSFSRNWVLRKIYPEAFKSTRSFADELFDILIEVN